MIAFLMSCGCYWARKTKKKKNLLARRHSIDLYSTKLRVGVSALDSEGAPLRGPPRRATHEARTDVVR